MCFDAVGWSSRAAPPGFWRRQLRVSALLIALVLASPVSATQIIPTGVEYTNDTIQQGGQLQACEIVVAIISPPAPEVVNLQLLLVGGQLGFKVAVGDLDWSHKSSVAKRISKAEFSAADFMHPDAFRQSVTPEGQLIAMLTQPALDRSFLKAFLDGGYSIQFNRDDASDERVYYIKQSPGADVRNTFAQCIHAMSAQAG